MNEGYDERLQMPQQQDFAPPNFEDGQGMNPPAMGMQSMKSYNPMDIQYGTPENVYQGNPGAPQQQAMSFMGGLQAPQQVGVSMQATQSPAGKRIVDSMRRMSTCGNY
jgi:hypothetical protein